MAKKRRRDSFNTTRTKNAQKTNSKRAKKKIMVDSIAAAPSKRIIDVNLDCLEKIFRLLDLKDLVDVAESNKYLKIAADMVFNRKYRTKVVLNNFNKTVAEPIRSPIDHLDYIHVQTLKCCFKILRLFGNYITIVEIRANPFGIHSPSFNVNCERLVHYVNKYCLNSLILFEVNRPSDNFLSAVKNAFKNVEHVEIRAGNVTSELPLQIKRVFPKMRQLVLFPYQFLNSKFIKYPYLENLHMNVFEKDDLYETSVRTAIISNPQLRCFRLTECCCEPRILKLISIKLKNLETLDIRYFLGHFNDFNLFYDVPIQFNKVEELSVSYHNEHVIVSEHEISAHLDTKYLSLGRLKIFNVTCFTENLTPLLNFAFAHSTIEKLTIETYIFPKDLSPVGLLLAKHVKLKFIEIELSMTNEIRDAELFLSFLEANQYLSTIKVLLQNQSVWDIVRRNIKSPWTAIKFLPVGIVYGHRP
ncbi:uncharacterized protein LOC129578118, partial [Sitodiplosis mosellana]|uniref:uncharacterized protein LOC129578118 n=1 Tax=Sitodiplosis mosellana TaxID=263140 RepID=UPI002444EFCA